MKKWTPNKTWARQVIVCCNKLIKKYQKDTDIDCPFCDKFRFLKETTGCEKCPWVIFTRRSQSKIRGYAVCQGRQGIGGQIVYPNYFYQSNSKRIKRIKGWIIKAIKIVEA